MSPSIKNVLSLALALSAGAALAACGSSSNTTTTTTDTATAAPVSNMKDSAMKANSRYGGPAYTGAPNLAATSALVAAGGGAANFSIATALTSMVGADLTNKEVAKLTKQYGKANAASFIKTFDFAVKDALKVATAAGVKLPAPAPLKGHALAAALVKAGLASDNTFWEELQLDHAVSHKIHTQVMDDIDAAAGYGKAADANYHKIADQAHYDLAQALGMKDVKLASFH